MKIFELESSEDFLFEFNILSAKIELDDTVAAKILKKTIQLTQQQLDRIDSQDLVKVEDSGCRD